MKSAVRGSRPVKRRRQANGKKPAPLSSKPAEPIRGRSRRAAGPSLTRSQITDRRRAEEALRENEEKYRNVVERANDGIAIIQDTIFKYLNPRLAEFWGGSVDELIGRPFSDYIHPDELPLVLDRYHRRMAGEDVTPTYETALKCKDGSKVYAELNAGTIMFHGEPADLVIVRDITDRKQAEEALAWERYLLGTLLDNLPDHIYFKDRYGRFTRISRSQAEAFGLSDPADALGKTDFDFFTEAHARPALEAEQNIIATGQPLVGLEEKETWPDGRLNWVHTSKMPLKDTAGNIIGTFGISSDINERKQAEEALAWEQYLLRTLLDNLPDRIYFKDRDGRFTRISRSQAEMFGLSDSAGALGKTDFDFFTEAHARPALEAEQNIMLTGQPLVGLEEKETWPDGRLTWVYTTKMPLRDKAGNLTGTFGISSDITERKRMEQALQQAEAKYRNIVNNAIEGIYQSTPAGSFFTANPSLARMLGYESPEELIAAVSNLNREFYVLPRRREEFVRQLTDHGTISNFESQAYRKDGSTIWISENARAVRGAEGQLHYEGTLVDVTERRQAQEELRRQSTHDSLTGLYNRGFFMAEMARIDRGREFPVSILMADVDHLKKTNDEGGHAAGDALLKRVAQVLTAVFRVEDVVARIGGDEFAVLLPATDEASAEVALQRVRRVVEENNSANADSPVRLSLGVSTADKPVPLSLALNEADANMYRAKRANDAS